MSSRQYLACSLTLRLQSNDFLREIWKPRPYIAAGGYARDTAFADADKHGDLIAFGRHFIPNVSLSTDVVAAYLYADIRLLA